MRGNDEYLVKVAGFHPKRYESLVQYWSELFPPIRGDICEKTLTFLSR